MVSRSIKKTKKKRSRYKQRRIHKRLSSKRKRTTRKIRRKSIRKTKRGGNGALSVSPPRGINSAPAHSAPAPAPVPAPAPAPVPAVEPEDPNMGKFSFNKALEYYIMYEAHELDIDGSITKIKSILQPLAENINSQKIDELPDLQNIPEDFITACYIEYEYAKANKIFQAEPLPDDINTKILNNPENEQPYLSRVNTITDTIVITKGKFFSNDTTVSIQEMIHYFITKYEAICLYSNKTKTLGEIFSTYSIGELNSLLESNTLKLVNEIKTQKESEFTTFTESIETESKRYKSGYYSNEIYQFSSNHISKCNVLLSIIKKTCEIVGEGEYNDLINTTKQDNDLTKMLNKPSTLNDQNKSIFLAYLFKNMDSLIHDDNLEKMIHLSIPLLSDQTSTYMSYGLVSMGLTDYLESLKDTNEISEYKKLFSYCYHTFNKPLKILLKLIDTLDLYINKLTTISRMYSQKYSALLGSLGAITLGGTAGGQAMLGPMGLTASVSVPNIPIGWKIFNDDSDQTSSLWSKLNILNTVTRDYKVLIKIGFIFMNSKDYLNNYRESIHNLIALLSKYTYNLEVINYKFNFVDDSNLLTDTVSPALAGELSPATVVGEQSPQPQPQPAPETTQAPQTASYEGIKPELSGTILELTNIRDKLIQNSRSVIEANIKDCNEFRMKKYHAQSKRLQSYRLPNMGVAKYGGPNLGPSKMFDTLEMYTVGFPDYN